MKPPYRSTISRARATPAASDGPRPSRRARSKADRALAEQMLAAIKAGGDLRVRKVRRLKASVKVRAYENSLKLAVAVERLTLDL